jgi:Ca2+/Na+ antiporter
MLDGLPWPLQLLLALVFVLISMAIIMYACDGFEPAADHLGTEVYKMGPGIRGASIEAVASSLPELFTTMFLLFVFHDEDGFSAGIATCAGSAIFNGAVIPALCILAVTIKGVKNDDGVVEKVTQIELYRGTLIRDGCFFLGAEIILIVFLNGTALSWWMGASLKRAQLFVC